MGEQDVVVVGGGPAGLMAADVLSAAGHPVALYDAMPSPGRKFLLAGKGGLNLTHGEPYARFLTRYGDRAGVLRPALDAFGPEAVRAWAASLGVETFVGSSGRVFPREMKAAPLLRRWLQRLRAAGVVVHVRHRWLGWDAAGALRFATPEGEFRRPAAATVLALGGGSWARLGSDGAWVPLLAAHGVAVAPLRPANCGFDVAWSSHLRERCAGAPVKSVTLSCIDVSGVRWVRSGELVVTEHGIEGSLVYALSAPLRDRIARDGTAVACLDLVPGRSVEALGADLARPRGRDTLARHLQRCAGLSGVKALLLRECAPDAVQAPPPVLAAAIKALPIVLRAPRPLDEAISSAGGIRFGEVDTHGMLRAMPGVFCAGEMLDWEAPTGGYLLTACLATGRQAGAGALAWLAAAAGR